MCKVWGRSSESCQKVGGRRARGILSKIFHKRGFLPSPTYGEVHKPLLCRLEDTTTFATPKSPGRNLFRVCRTEQHDPD